MSNKTKSLLVIIIVLISAAIFFLPNDEKTIKGNLASLAEYCSTTNGEAVVETLHKVTLGSKLCTDPCKVEIQSRNFNGELSRKEISDKLLMLKKRLSTTQFQFEDIHIEFPSKETANVLTTVRLNGETADGNFTDAYEVDINTNKIEGKWLFSSFTVVEFMKK